MKFICTKNDILESLEIADRVVNVKNSTSILSTVLLEVDTTLKLVSSSGSLSFISDVKVDIVEKGGVAVHCNKLYSIVKKLPDSDLEFSIIDYNLIIIVLNNKKIKYIIKGVDKEKFPVINIKKNVFKSIDKKYLVSALKKAVISIDIDGSRRFAKGIYIDNKNIISTDGKRASIIKNAIDSFIDNHIILSYELIQELLKVEFDKISLSIDENKIVFKLDNYIFIGNLIDMSLIPYEKLIPERYEISIELKVSELKDKLNRIQTMCDSESNKVIFSFTQNMVDIRTENVVFGEGNENIVIDYNNSNISISLNNKFILDVLNVVETDIIIMSIVDMTSVVSIREKDNNNYIYLMMPMVL